MKKSQLKQLIKEIINEVGISTEGYSNYDTDTAVKDVAPDRKTNVAGCKYCDIHKFDKYAPPHEASPNCESGKKPHCTCDVCY